MAPDTADLADQLDELTNDDNSDRSEDDLRTLLDEQARRWRQWIDDLRVRADLGAADARDDLKDLYARLEDAYVGFVSVASLAGEQAKGAAGDLRARSAEARHQLARAGAVALERLRS
jgi:hypothetical protein